MTLLNKFIEHKAYNMRISSLMMTSMAGSGHPTSALSAADLVAALFFYGMHFNPDDYGNPNNDRFILSKGHASPILYAVWKELGKLSEQELLTYRDIDSPLEGHPTLRFPYAEAATGSLGMGLSVGVGQALCAKLDKRDYNTFVLLGDGELAEGSIWEAAELAHHNHLDNLTAVIDCNRLGQTGETLHGHHVKRYEEKFHAFGWHTLVIDGHDVRQITAALDKAREHENQPTVIIAKTIKGQGVEHAQDKNGFHGKAFTKQDLNTLLPALEEKYADDAEFTQDFTWEPKIPEEVKLDHQQEPVTMGNPRYEMHEEVPTRKAYGQALVAAGQASHDVVSLDAEVKNSTFAELFEAKYPERFFQCFIAEQNMVSMAVGFDRRGKLPFVSTFGAFFSRAYDQIRMAAIGSVHLKLVGSHAGVSIGQDGPSQMGLEDIALMRAVPNSVVLYPCDAVATYKLVNEMANYRNGISYLRTTRMATPVIYDNAQNFDIGGSNVLQQSDKDVACIVAAGVTVFEALKAQHMLQQDGINVAVIDLYSIKPLDAKTLLEVGKKSGNKIITVEDHYLEGGLGQAVSYALCNSGITVECLAVTELPRSGKPHELMAWAGIDADAIIKKVQ